MKSRKIIFQASATAAILLLAFIFNACTPDIDTKAVNSKVDEYMSELVKQKRFSGSMLIAKDGKPIVKRSYGMANIADKTSNTPQTRFRIGEITDQLKAAAIIKLQEQGKLKLSDRISEYLDDCPDAWKSVLILHLLNQSSGIPDYARFQNFVEISSQKKMTPVAVVSLFKDKTLEFGPGTKVQFSNSNYLLIGLIIEEASGMSYMDFMQKTIFKPLDMENTGFAGHGEIIKSLATGYELKENGFNKADLQDIFPYSALSIYSTVEDLFIWDQSLYSGKLLSHQTLNIMFPPSARGIKNGSIIDFFDRKMIFIYGGILSGGFSSYFAHFPEDNISIIILSNLDIKSCPIYQTNLCLSAIVFGKNYELPKERKVVKVDPAIYDKYTGEYQLVFAPYLITVTREGNKLITQMLDQPKFEVFPVSETTFLHIEFQAELEFIKDAGGHVTLLVVRQSGHEVLHKKLHNNELTEYKAGAGNINFDKKLKSHGFDPGDISKLISLIENRTFPNIHSLIIMRGGDVILEKYFNGYNAWDAHMLYSASKSFTSALIGIALDKGCLKSVDQKILSFFPHYKKIENLNDWKKMITIEDLLTMRSGVDFYGPGIDSPDGRLNSLIAGWDRFYLNQPMTTEPGTSFHYEGGGVIPLSEILKSTCGMHAGVFADKWLFQKLGISGAYWFKNWEKHTHTGIGLHMKPIDMAKFGQLYLNKGMWNGEQVIPAKWIDESWKMHVDFHGEKHPYTGDYGIGYGYLWWISKPAREGQDSQNIYAVNGGGGQRVFVIPEYDMVVVVTAGAKSIEESLNPEKMLYEHIIPAIRE